MFLRRAGGDDTALADPDTVPTGGRFNGVLAGLEKMRTLETAGVITRAPPELVNRTNEEKRRMANGAELAMGVVARPKNAH